MGSSAATQQCWESSPAPKGGDWKTLVRESGGHVARVGLCFPPCCHCGAPMFQELWVVRVEVTLETEAV